MLTGRLVHPFENGPTAELLPLPIDSNAHSKKAPGFSQGAVKERRLKREKAGRGAGLLVTHAVKVSCWRHRRPVARTATCRRPNG